MNQRILLVEDDVELAELTSSYLTDYGFETLIEGNGKTAVHRIINEQPDLVILDIMLPEIDGLEVCRRVRDKFNNPILMLTAITGQIDQILGLEIGADDYICKPVEPRLLLARIKVLLRRINKSNKSDSNSDTNNKLIFDNLIIDNDSRSVILENNEIMLSSPEYDLLWLLAQNAGNILSREEIFNKLRGIDYDGISRTIDINISHIRSKIQDDPQSPKRIKTIRNKGYLFVKHIE
jgi:two-component system, OmpR family, response regulator RstA